MNIRWKTLGIAFVLSFILWYGISGSEKFESQIEVRVDYKGTPTNLVVLDGQVNKINVRIRASAGQLLTMSGNEYRCFIDLSGITEGDNVLPITVEQLPFIRGIEVVEISPPRVILNVDALEKKNVPLELVLSNRRGQQHQIDVSVKPEEVEISGARTQLGKIHKLEIPFALADQYPLGVTEYKKAIPLPDGIDAPVREVTLSVTATENLKPVKVTKTVVLPDAKNDMTFWSKPDKISMTLMVPEHMVKAIAGNPSLHVSVQMPPDPDPGNHTLPVEIALPEGVRLTKLEPKSVTVIVQKKKAAAPAAGTPQNKKR